MLTKQNSHEQGGVQQGLWIIQHMKNGCGNWGSVSKNKNKTTLLGQHQLAAFI